MLALASTFLSTDSPFLLYVLTRTASLALVFSMGLVRMVWR
jgi:hypothetical protein